MIPHIVIFHKQIDHPLAKQTKRDTLSACFSPARPSLCGSFCGAAPLDFLPYMRYTMCQHPLRICQSYPPLCCRGGFFLTLYRGRPFHGIERAQYPAIQKNDRDPHPQADPGACRSHDLKHADHQHLQSGRHLFCGPDLHQRFRRGRRRFQPDGHYSGHRLFLRSGQR